MKTDEARALLQRAAAVEPDEGHSKFMYLAQLVRPAVVAFHDLSSLGQPSSSFLPLPRD